MYFPWSLSIPGNSLTNPADGATWSGATRPGSPATVITGGVLPGPASDRHFLYALDSGERTADFVWSQSSGGALIAPTGIPVLRDEATLAVSVLTGPSESIVDTSRDWAAKYDHPRVLQTPDGRWLLLMTRQLITDPGAEEELDLEGAFAFDDPASMSVRDLVAYLSLTPDFTSVWGPVTVVSGLDAVPNQTLRLWPGVPTGVFLDDVLHLYYTVQPSSEPFHLDDVGVTGDLYRQLRSEEFVAWPRLASGRGAIAMKTIEWTDLEAAFLAATGETADVSDVVAGTLEGLVRFWIADGSRPNEELLLTRLEEQLSLRHGLDFTTETDQAYSPNIVDPDVVLCPDGTLTIYVAVRPAVSTDLLDGTDGMGVWRGAVVDPTSLGRLPRAAGLDFIMSLLQSSGESDDLVIASDLDDEDRPFDFLSDPVGLFVDPDAVLLPDGTARVLCSGGLKPNGRPPYGMVVEVAGTSADACDDWMMAW